MGRRLAAILAADVVGYSRMIRADEEGTIAALKSMRANLVEPKIEQHHGRVVKLMGDGMLSEFASVVDAVRAAVETQMAVSVRNAGLPKDKRIMFRVGINLGDVVIDGDDIQGDGVNLAARLEGLAEPGGICISAAAYDQVRDRLDVPFADMGEHRVKNIDRPVQVWRWVSDEPSENPATAGRLLPLPDKPSIAVLPFDNLSGDPEQEYFADGMTEDIITLLATVPDLFVIARNSTFTYKNQSVDVRNVAKELGVRYVLEGSVRKAGNRIRVTGQFIEATSGNHIWADRYDRDLDDIFIVQDELAQGIAGALQSRLLIAESAYVSRKAPEKLDAWGNIVNAKLRLLAFRKEDLIAAEPFARRAIDIEPDYAEGHAVLGHVLAWRTWNGWTEDFKQTARDALHHCEQALRLGANDPSVLTDVAFSLWWLGRQDEAVPHLHRASELNPNSPITVAMQGYSLCAQGRPEEGLALCEKALRLSPRDPLEYFFLYLLGSGQLHAGHYADAKSTIERSLQINPDLTVAHATLASICVMLGKIGEAKAALGRVEALSTTAIPFLFRARTKLVRWHELTDPLREIYDGPLPDRSE